MSEKYVIEIPNRPGEQKSIKTLDTSYCVEYLKNFGWLQKRLNETYDEGFEKGKEVRSEEQSRENGSEDAWRLAEFLFSKASDRECAEIFPEEWENGGYKAIAALPYEKVKRKYDAWKACKQDEEIRVGDEVVWTNGGNPFIVLTIAEIAGSLYYTGIDTVTGKTIYGGLTYTKTGRHFDEIPKAIKKLMEKM